MLSEECLVAKEIGGKSDWQSQIHVHVCLAAFLKMWSCVRHATTSDPSYTLSELLAWLSVEGQSVEGLVHVPLGNGQVPRYRIQHGRLHGTTKTMTIALCDVLDH